MNRMKKLRACFVVFLTVLLVTGCGGTVEKSTSSISMAEVPMENGYVTGSGDGGYYDEALEEEAYREESPDDQIQGERKLIRNVNLEVETKEFDALTQKLQQQVTELGGYIEHRDSYNGSSYSGYRNQRYANWTIRIPKQQLDSFINHVSDISNVIQRSDSVEDVTLTYVDTESRRDALQVEQTRLLELLESAESLDDILTIEERLTDVRYQLESIESRLRTLDNQVDFSTVYLSVSEVWELTPTEEETVWNRMKDGFMESLQGVGDGFLDVFIWFVVHIPNLVVCAGIILVIVWMIRRRRRKKKISQEKELSQ